MTSKRNERIILITQYHLRNPKESKYGDYFMPVYFHTLKICRWELMCVCVCDYYIQTTEKGVGSTEGECCIDAYDCVIL